MATDPDLTDPELIVENLPLEDIRPNPRNARRHSPKQIEHLKRAVQRSRVIVPVLVDANNVLIAGHGRLEVAKQQGRKTIPAIRIKHLTETDARLLAIADNRIAELATWDDDMLRLELSELILIEPDIAISDVTGFSTPAIDALIHGEDFATADPADSVLSAPPEAPITQLGDLFAIGLHKVVCADARDATAYDTLLEGKKAQQVFTDPPYNIVVKNNVSGKGKVRHDNFVLASGEMNDEGFTDFHASWMGASSAHLTPDALTFAFMDGRQLRPLLNAGTAMGLVLAAMAVWAKTNSGMGSFYRSQIEHVAIFAQPSGSHINNIELGRHGRNRSNLWTYAGMNVFGAERDAALKLHPTVKPVSLIADAILDATRRGDIVLDPFVGSGSTLIAAHRTGRIGYGIELDPRYVDVTLDRLSAVLGLDPVRVRDGARWSDLRAQQKEGSR